MRLLRPLSPSTPLSFSASPLSSLTTGMLKCIMILSIPFANNSHRKRKYSNEETREVALPWFWENCKFDEFSIWRFDYLYNEELTMTFMSNNQIGGFFARLEGSRKYIFGAGAVFGQTNDSVIQGAFVVRGQDATPAFEVAPDMTSYKFTKLDPTKEEDKEFVNDMWAWDKPVTVDGKTYDFADGKVFK